ncbi:hypothetical protein TKK_0010455 [Trichogramma kaykai]
MHSFFDYEFSGENVNIQNTLIHIPILLDTLATLEAALLNNGDTPTFTGALGYSVIDLTFASDTFAPLIASWAVSELYTHSDHQAIVFEIATARPPGPTTRQSCKWNARTLDTECLSAMMASDAVPPESTEEMATRRMATITSACDASMVKSSGRRHRCVVYWWTSEIADLQRSCLRARRLAQRARGRPNEGPPRRTMPLQDVSCALPSRPVSAYARANYAMRSMRMYGPYETVMCRLELSLKSEAGKTGSALAPYSRPFCEVIR